VATIHRVGKGAVLVGTPVWLNVKGNKSRMHPLFSEIIGRMADELVPVKVTGGEVKVMYNRNESGWVVTLMRVRGDKIDWPGQAGPSREDQTPVKVTLTPRFKYSEALEWLTGGKLGGSGAEDEVGLTIPPGEIRIVEFRVK
jgi:hypothetical protein